MAASPKKRIKKYNPIAKAQKHRAQKLRVADFKIRKALQGVMVAFNSGIGDDGLFYMTGWNRLADLLNGDSETALAVALEIRIRWRIYITINCESDWEHYCYALPVIDMVSDMHSLNTHIDSEVIPRALAQRNAAHFKDWGYWGEIL